MYELARHRGPEALGDGVIVTLTGSPHRLLHPVGVGQLAELDYQVLVETEGGNVGKATRWISQN